MTYNRRKFIRAAGAFSAASLLLPQFGCTGGSGEQQNETTEEETVETPPSPSLSAFGIQLYTLRDLMPGDPKGMLKNLADYGYQQIEGYEGDQGMFWGMSHTDFKSYLDSIGLNMVASHCDMNKDFEKKAAQAAEIGMKYLICPYVGPQKKMDDFKKLADKFNQCGVICQKNGIRFAYHNHDYSFVELEGAYPQDVMMSITDPATVDYEMDIYWVVTGGADPVAYLQKYPNRFRLCHVKDRIKGASLEEKEASCDLGTGSIDYPSILKIAAENGMQYYILEQERYDNSTPLKSAEAGAKYLKELVFS